MSETSLDAIAKRLRATREALGLSQIQLAKRADISPTAWNNYEQAIKRISIDNGLKLCRSTGVTLDWIYRGDKSGLPGRIIERLP